MTKLYEHEPHDIVVVEVDGVDVYVEIGALNGTALGTKKGRSDWKPDYALVRTYDPDEADTVLGSLRTMSVDADVVAVYETARHRREMKAMTARRLVYDGEENDPMLKRKGGF